MTVRFQADADLNAEIVAGVLRREPSIDFQTDAIPYQYRTDES